MKKERAERLIKSFKQALEHTEIKTAVDSALKNNRIDSADQYEKIEVVFDRLMSQKTLGESEETIFLKLAELMETYGKENSEVLRGKRGISDFQFFGKPGNNIKNRLRRD